MSDKKYYFAYGMNCNINEMAARCPNSTYLGTIRLDGYRLDFKGHADIVAADDSITGVLWGITPQCEASLDMLEGYPKYYNKLTVHLPEAGPTMVYKMPGGELREPDPTYFTSLADGYVQNDLPLDQLRDAANRCGFDYSEHLDLAFLSYRYQQGKK